MLLFGDVATTRISLGRKGDAKNAPLGWITLRDASPPWRKAALSSFRT
jgi:hypothetical protein